MADQPEATVSLDEPTASVELDTGTAPVADDEVETEARKAGWVPKDRWNKNPDHWRPAKDFLDVRDKVLPVVQRENKALRERLEIQGARLEALERQQANYDQQRQALGKETLKYERQQALQNGDHAKVNEIDAKLIDVAVTERTRPTPQQPQIDPEVNRIWTDFAQENEWVQDPKMQRVLFAQLKTMRESGTDIAGREMLEEAKEFITRLYPERFTRESSPSRRNSAMAETGGSGGASRSGTRTWNDLKPEVKAALEPMVGEYGMTREGILKQCAQDPVQYFRR